VEVVQPLEFDRERRGPGSRYVQPDLRSESADRRVEAVAVNLDRLALASRPADEAAIRAARDITDEQDPERSPGIRDSFPSLHRGGELDVGSADGKRLIHGHSLPWSRFSRF